MGDLQSVLCLHFLRDVKTHAKCVLANQFPIRNSKDIKLYPDQFAVFALQPFDQFEVLALALL